MRGVVTVAMVCYKPADRDGWNKTGPRKGSSYTVLGEERKSNSSRVRQLDVCIVASMSKLGFITAILTA
jgi:hypothetical protein